MYSTNLGLRCPPEAAIFLPSKIAAAIVKGCSCLRIIKTKTAIAYKNQMLNLIGIKLDCLSFSFIVPMSLLHNFLW